MRRIQVTLHSEEGQWWAESSDVAEFTAVADSLVELRKLAQEGLAFYLDEPEVELNESIVFEDSNVLSFYQKPLRPTAWYVPNVTSGVAVSPSRTGASVPVRELNPAY